MSFVATTCAMSVRMAGMTIFVRAVQKKKMSDE